MAVLNRLLDQEPGGGAPPLPGFLDVILGRFSGKTSVLEVIQIGEYAEQLLCPNASGKVLASVSNAVYLQTCTDEIFWLGSEQVPIHRRAIVSRRPVLQVSAGSSFQMAGTVLFLEDGMQIETGKARLWRTPDPRSFPFTPVRIIPERLLAFCRSYTPRGAEGFGALLPFVVNWVWPEEFRSGSWVLNPEQQAALPVLEMIVACCLKRDLSGALQVGEQLIGLGAGLTPSGDDFLGGLLFTSYSLVKLYRIDIGIPENELHSWTKNLRFKTNPISCAILTDHIAGFSADELHGFVRLLFGGGTVETLVSCARRLERIGNTTGTDLLTGVIAAALLLF